MGAPSLYKPAYCQQIIQYLAEGHTIKAFAGHIGVGLRTVYDWIKQHDEFADAHEIGEAKSLGFWEDKLIAAAKGDNKDAAPSVLIFGVKNRGSEYWRDVHKIEHGKPGDFSTMSDDDLDAIIASAQGAISASNTREAEASNKKGMRGKSSGLH